MTTRLTRFHLLLSLAASLAGASGHAAEMAVVKQGRINVRGQASLAGEVITQLKQGEPVIILSETNLAKPKAGEPARWYQIKMPENTPVWVFASYIDTNKTVAITRLNLRAGPGENYSVVGRLLKGETVKDIRTVDDWMEIETPATAYAYISTDLVEVTGKTNLAALVPAAAAAAVSTNPPPPLETPVMLKSKPLPPEPAPAQVKQTLIVPPPVPVRETAAPPVLPAATAPAAVVPATPPPTVTVKSLPTPAATPPPVVPAAAAPAKPAPVAKPVEAPLPKRVVRREGIVRSTVSIQAPTYFELINPDTRRTVDYLHAETIDLQLKDYRGKKVVVTGEEGVDPRWPNTPVLEIETLELVP